MALNVFEPLKFSTQGINDLATKQSLIVTDGKITVDTVEPKKEITFVGTSFADVEGKGIKWSDGRKHKSLIFKKSKLHSDLSFNLTDEQDYQIGDTTVLSMSALGPTVTKSNLKTLGTLKSLNVSGDTVLGEFAGFYSDLNRVGINTESPAGALGIQENGVDIFLGSNKIDTATLGTIGNDHLEFVTDSTTRITIGNNGDVRVHGKLFAEEVVTARSSPLVFQQTESSTNYGKGIVWSGMKGSIKQFILQASPDRIWSTEHIDLQGGRHYNIDNTLVLGYNELGHTVTESHLQKLGVLRELQVAGDAAVTRTLSTTKISIANFSIVENELHAYGDIKIGRHESTEISIGDNIVVGNPANYSRTVSVYGNLAVGVAKPDDGYALTVAGPVSLDNKKFLKGITSPNTGQFNKGDIVWNTDPKASDYIGWVCVTPGEPGHWLPFGAIASR